MKIHLGAFLVLVAFLPVCACALPAFPGAAGFGSMTTAGSGRHLAPPRTTVHKVKTLLDGGPDSLRACVTASGPRVCVFEVGGEIRLQSVLRVKEPYLTIAGQTAPSPGIVLTQGGIRVETHDVLIQHLAIRVGDEPGPVKGEDRDGLGVGASKGGGAYNVVLDHLSLTWAIDENFSTWEPSTHDVTLSNSIVAEGLDNSIHPKGAHSKGLLIGDGSKRVSLIGNLIAHNIERNPYFKPGVTAEVLGNLVYGWGPKGGWMLCNLSDNAGTNEPVLLNFIGNVYKPGPKSVQVPVLYAKPPASGTRVYVKDNIGPGRTASDDEWKISSLPADRRSDSPALPPSGAKATASSEAEARVLASAGSRPKERLNPDARIVQEVRSGTGGIKDCVSGCENAAGGWPELKQSERSLTLPTNPDSDEDKDGYTNLEEWLQSFAKEVE